MTRIFKDDADGNPVDVTEEVTGRISNQRPEFQDLPYGGAPRGGKMVTIEGGGRNFGKTLRAAHLIAQMQHETGGHEVVTIDSLSALSDVLMAEAIDRAKLAVPSIQVTGTTTYDEFADNVGSDIDFTGIEERLAAAYEALDRFPVHPLSRDPIPVDTNDIYKTVYGGPGVKYRGNAHTGQAAKALNKRRAKNKAARKARRK